MPVTDAEIVKALIGCYYGGQVRRDQVRRELIAEVNGWCVQATTYIDGAVIRPTLDQVRLFGAALGRLHELPPAGPAPAPGRSSAAPCSNATSTATSQMSVRGRRPGEMLRAAPSRTALAWLTERTRDS